MQRWGLQEWRSSPSPLVAEGTVITVGKFLGQLLPELSDFPGPGPLAFQVWL